MLVRMACGSRRGQVVDFLPHEARAMLADGRATLPDAPPSLPDPSVTMMHVETRRDRVPMGAKQRRTR